LIRGTGLRHITNDSYWRDSKDIKIICSLVQTKLEITNKKGGKSMESQYVASSVLYWNDLNYSEILKILMKLGVYIPIIKIIKRNYSNSEEQLTKFVVNLEMEDLDKVWLNTGTSHQLNQDNINKMSYRLDEARCFDI
jgi:hypothetical protein